MKLAWATDIHLDFLQDSDVIAFAQKINQSNVDGVIITGDISTGGKLVYHLGALEHILQKPIYYTLGNHDYWGTSMKKMKNSLIDLSRVSQYLTYLSNASYIPLSKSTALIGDDGWYDAQYGSWTTSNFVLNDWHLIDEFKACNGNLSKIVLTSRSIAVDAAKHVAESIKGAARYHRNIIIATHFPPFEQAHIFRGKVGDANAQPWYTSKIMGDTIRAAAAAYSNCEFTVLAGHTHGAYSGKITKNITCHVGEASYGKPRISDMITVL